jgi:hypothetical protein
MRTPLFLLILISVLTRCNQVPTEVAQKPYFDIDSFFTDQINLLQNDSLVVMKTSAINGKTDQHQMNWTDWKREFALFLASDINKVSLIGKYMVDTLPGKDSGDVKIRYSAQDSSMRTRLVEVTFNDHQPKVIYITNKTSGFLTSSSENLLYLPLKGYVIKTSTKNKFFGGNDFSAMGQITTKEKKYF